MVYYGEYAITETQNGSYFAMQRELYDDNQEEVGRQFITIEHDIDTMKLSKVSIHASTNNSMEIIYRNGIFHEMLHNGIAINPAHKKSLYQRTIRTEYDDDNLFVYYGVTLYPLRPYDENIVSNEIVLGIHNIPAIIATLKDNVYVNPRPFSYQNLLVFKCDLLPFELQVDLPNDEECLEVWCDALRTIITENTHNNPTSPKAKYIKRFFGNIVSTVPKNTNIRITKLLNNVGNVLITTIQRFDYKSYLIGNQHFLMTFENNYIYYIVNGIGYDTGTEDSSWIVSEEDDDVTYEVEVYTGNGNFIDIELNNETCIMNDQLIASGFTCKRHDVYDPFWDAFGIMRAEDISYATMKWESIV